MTSSTPDTAPRAFTRWLLLAPLGAGLLLLLYTFLLGMPPDGTDPILLFTDPATVIWRNSPIDYMFVGALSQFGVALWIAGASFALLGAISLWMAGGPRRLALFLGLFGVLGFVMGLDDLLVFHERIVQDLSGGVIGQHHVMLFYGLAWAAFFVVFRREALRTAPVFLAVMLVLLGASYSMDVVTDLIPFIDLSAYKETLDLVEEGFKLLGTFAFMATGLRLGLAGIAASRGESPG